MKRFLLTLLASTIIAGSASAATIVINSEVEVADLDAKTVEKIYLGKKTLWDSGQRITPALVSESKGVSKTFLEEILHKSVPQYRAYWKKRLFSGGGTVPKTFRTSREVVEFVKRTPGAIGVVETAPNDGSVIVITVTRAAR